MSKRINLLLDDEIVSTLEKFRISMGYDDLPATLRAIIRLHKSIPNDVTQIVSEKTLEPAKAPPKRKYDDLYIQKWIEDNSVGMPYVNCPIHPGAYVYTCGCLMLAGEPNHAGRERITNWFKEQMI